MEIQEWERQRNRKYEKLRRGKRQREERWEQIRKSRFSG